MLPFDCIVLYRYRAVVKRKFGALPSLKPKIASIGDMKRLQQEKEDEAAAAAERKARKEREKREKRKKKKKQKKMARRTGSKSKSKGDNSRPGSASSLVRMRCDVM